MPDGITIDIMQDKSLATDPVIFSGLSNGSTTGNPNQRSLYVANPRGADSNFTVTAQNN